MAPASASMSDVRRFNGAGRFLQFGEITRKIAERLTRLFALESCDDRIVPDGGM